MFDPVYFENRFVVVEGTREAVLADAEFRERSAGERFEELTRFSPLGVDDLVEFRDDPVLDV